MFTVVYTDVSGTTITDANVRAITIEPQNDRTAPQSIRINTGIGGGGQFGAGTVIPISRVTSIDVREI